MAVRFKKSRKTEAQGRRLIVTIGIDAYTHLNPLRNAVGDADAVEDLFVTELGYEAPYGSFRNKNATQQAINQLVLETLSKKPKSDDKTPSRGLEPDDTLIFFFAGHGTVDDKQRGGGIGYLAPVHAEGEKWSTYIDATNLLETIGRLTARHILVIIDSCHSGYALSGTFARHVEVQPGDKHALSRRVFTSARAYQAALDGDTMASEHSPFTTILLDAFKPAENGNFVGADLTQDGQVQGFELEIFILLEFEKRLPRYMQRPDFGRFHQDSRGEFVLATKGKAQRRPTAGSDRHAYRIALLNATKDWLQNKGAHSSLYQGHKLKEALDWQARQDEYPYHYQVETFLKAGRQWQWQKRVGLVGVCLAALTMLYFIGDAVRKQRLWAAARVDWAEFQTAKIPLGAERDLTLVEAFRLDVHEVSAHQYRLCYRAEICEEPANLPNYAEIELMSETELLPMVNVTALEAHAYCVWQGGHLPSAAEWEYAVRDTYYRSWPWGEDEPANNYANINVVNIDDQTPVINQLATVRDVRFADGVTDKDVWHLIGNASEWTRTLVADCPHDRYGLFPKPYRCETWDGVGAPAAFLTVGRTFFDDISPEDAVNLSLAISGLSNEYHDKLGFRCAYEVMK